MAGARPVIPAATKRAVRQRCGFGCVFCGIPVVHYDHIVDYALTKTHDEGNITLLCPTHHQEKSSGRIPVERVIAANEKPFALAHPMRAGHPLEYFYGAEFNFGVGSVLFTSKSLWGGKPAPGAIIVDGGKVLAGRVEDGQILISLMIRDADNRQVLVLRDNEMRLGVSAWDVKLVGSRLTIWWSEGELGIDLRFAPDGVYIERGALYANGYLFQIDEQRRLLVGNAVIGQSTLPGTAIYAGQAEARPRCGTYIDESQRYRKPAATLASFMKDPSPEG